MTFNLFPLYVTCSAQATLHWYSSLALFSSNKNREGESLFFFPTTVCIYFKLFYYIIIICTVKTPWHFLLVCSLLHYQ